MCDIDACSEACAPQGVTIGRTGVRLGLRLGLEEVFVFESSVRVRVSVRAKPGCLAPTTPPSGLAQIYLELGLG